MLHLPNYPAQPLLLTSFAPSSFLPQALCIGSSSSTGLLSPCLFVVVVVVVKLAPSHGSLLKCHLP